MGDGVGKINHKVVIPSTDGVTVTIEGENQELVKWLQLHVVTIMKNYYYMGIPEDLKHAVYHNHIKSKFDGTTFSIKEKKS